MGFAIINYTPGLYCTLRTWRKRGGREWKVFAGRFIVSGKGFSRSMFTGIIVEKGTIAGIARGAGSMALKVRGPVSAGDAKPGDSVAVNGVCLTVTSVSGDVMTMDVGEETFRRTSLSGLGVSSEVNLEPALRAGDRLGGHIVTGHVDAVGSIAGVRALSSEVEISVRFPKELAVYIAEKGSVAVDGISLTVGELRGDAFVLHIIPHTLGNTTLADRRAGDRVNLEVDVLARYVVNALGRDAAGGSGLVRKMMDFGYMKAVDNA